MTQPSARTGLTLVTGALLACTVSGSASSTGGAMGPTADGAMTTDTAIVGGTDAAAAPDAMPMMVGACDGLGPPNQWEQINPK